MKKTDTCKSSQKSDKGYVSKQHANKKSNGKKEIAVALRVAQDRISHWHIIYKALMIKGLKMGKRRLENWRLPNPQCVQEKR